MWPRSARQIRGYGDAGIRGFLLLIHYLFFFFLINRKKMSYKTLEIWKLSRELVIEIHSMTISQLPKFELYELGSQIRRSSKSIQANIVEGYGRRAYKKDFIHFLILAKSSADETLNHLETLFETKSLKNKDLYQKLKKETINLNRKLYYFIESVKTQHNNFSA